MMHFDDRHKNGALIAAAVVVVVILLIWFFRPKSSGGACPICNFLSGLSGPSAIPAGTTNPGVLNGTNSATGAPNMAFQTYDYTVPVPSYHYSGNSQIYMPLFGFVGYSSTGTM